MLKNLKIRQKIFFAFSFVVALILMIGLWNYFSLKEIDDKKVDLLTVYEAADAIMESKFYLKSDAQIVMEIISAQDNAAIQMQIEKHTKNKERINEEIPNAINIFNDGNWGHEFSQEKLEYKKQLEQMSLVYKNEIQPLIISVADLSAKKLVLDNDENLMSEIDKLDEQLDKSINQIVDAFDDLEYKLEDSIVENSKSSINQTIISSKSLSFILMLIGVLISIVLTVVIAETIRKPVDSLVKAIEKLRNGELDIDVDYNSKDEIGTMVKALNETTNQLKNIVLGIKEGAVSISGASDHINAGAQNISQGANESASSVEEISSSIEEMAANIQQNADNAATTEKIAMQTDTAIKKGNWISNGKQDENGLTLCCL